MGEVNDYGVIYLTNATFEQNLSGRDRPPAISSEMARAGVAALESLRESVSDKYLVEAIYSAMWTHRQTKKQARTALQPSGEVAPCVSTEGQQ